MRCGTPLMRAIVCLCDAFWTTRFVVPRIYADLRPQPYYPGASQYLGCRNVQRGFMREVGQTDVSQSPAVQADHPLTGDSDGRRCLDGDKYEKSTSKRPLLGRLIGGCAWKEEKGFLRCLRWLERVLGGERIGCPSSSPGIAKESPGQGWR